MKVWDHNACKAEIESLSQQLSASQKREVTLRKLIGEIYCSDDSSAEVTRKIEDVLNGSYSKESTHSFEDWHNSHAKYMEPADIIHWCRDSYDAGRVSGQDDAESLRQRLVTLKTELKSIGEAIDDPRTDLTMTMSELILEYKQQLAAALDACKLKDEALGYRIDHPKVIAALAIQPDDQLTEAYEAGKLEAIPEGWVLVPKEPTEEMLRAPWLNIDELTSFKLKTAHNYYKAMLAVAPKGEE